MSYSGKFDIYYPAKFDGLNFPIWKVKMIIFLNSLGSRVVKVISKPFVCPNGNEDSWSEITVKEYNANSKDQYALLQDLNDDDVFRVINCTCAYDIWQVLITTHEGTSQVKKSKIDFLNSQYDSFHMFDDESIEDMLTRFTTIANGLISLGKPIDNDQKVRKIIRALPQAWESKLPL